MKSDSKHSAASPQNVMKATNFARKNRETFINELKEFLRFPSVGTQPDRKSAMLDSAQWLLDKLGQAGLENLQKIPTAGHPIVYGDWLHAGESPTVLIYGHYDVQPADPLDEWESDPFEPAILGDYMYARGVSDDKGQLLILVKSIESYLSTVGSLPVNIKFILEGEEESGSENLYAFVKEYANMLAADVCLISDTAMLGPDQPSIVYGLRGLCYAYIDITGPYRDLHSGSYGGGIDNPLNVLAQIIARLRNEHGKILIPGFYDDVRPIGLEEREHFNSYPLDEEGWLAETGSPAKWGEPEFILTERLGARPTLDVNGLLGGYTGEGAKTVLPSTGHAKISMRLVPDQEPAKVFKLFQDYVLELAPPTVTVVCTFVHGASPVIVNLEHPAIEAAGMAYQDVFGCKPIFMREGGSLPVVGLLQQRLGLETVLMGFGLGDDRIHSPNERFYLPNLYKGVVTAIKFLDLYGRSTG